MKHPKTFFSAIAALSLASAGLAHGQAQPEQAPDRYIVKLKENVAPAGVAAIHGVVPDFVYTKAVNGFAGRVPPGRLRALETDPRVESVVPDRRVVAIAKGGKPGGGGGGGGQTVPEGVKRIGAAPGSLAYTGAGIGVAVVDTGLDFNHADLAPLGNASYSAFGGSAQDDEGHGTHVGGIIAARNNNIDTVGVAHGSTLYAVKVLDQSGNGSDATVIGGLDWIALNHNAVAPPIRVVNMSLGRAGNLDDNPALRRSVQSLVNSGIAVIVAAGNDCNLEVSQQVPATYPEVMAIGSTTAAEGNSRCRFFPDNIPADTASYFTTDGGYDVVTGIGVIISAPGADMENVGKNCFIESVGILSTRLGGGTTRLSGTSMAAPHAAGVVALLYQKSGGALSPESARAKLMGGASAKGIAPKNSPTSCYSFDGDREGILSAPGALAAP